MPRTVKPEVLAFLDALHEWVQGDKPTYDFEAPSSTIAYRLNRVGLKPVRVVGLVDDRTGESYAALKKRGEIKTA